jgi:hypothetical protein
MNLPPFNPPAPGQINIRSFQDLRTFLLEFVVNRWMQYVNNYIGNELLPALKNVQPATGTTLQDQIDQSRIERRKKA